MFTDGFYWSLEPPTVVVYRVSFSYPSHLTSGRIVNPHLVSQSVSFLLYFYLDLSVGRSLNYMFSGRIG